MLPLIALGMLPCSFIYAFGGNAIFSENLAQLVIFAVLIIILALFQLVPTSIINAPAVKSNKNS
jgi:uncharacterized membrane protein YdjX (TVP38/TMEM64 family)